MKMPTMATFFRLPDGTIGFRNPYSRAFGDDVRAGVPKESRRWDRKVKTWFILPPFGDVVVQFARSHFGSVTELPFLPPAPAPPPTLRPHELLHVAPNAPRIVVLAAYRALAREAHPDRGGTHESMVELNRAKELMMGGC